MGGRRAGNILVFTRFILLLSHEACPVKPPSFKDRFDRRLVVQINIVFQSQLMFLAYLLSIPGSEPSRQLCSFVSPIVW